MSFFSEYIPNPNPLALFKSRDGHPFIQSFARNVGESVTGKKINDMVDQRFFGDHPIDPNATNDTLNSPQNIAMQQFLQNWLQQKQQ